MWCYCTDGAIYTITSDNGANIVKAVKLIEDQLFCDNEPEFNEDENDIADIHINDGLADTIVDETTWTNERIMSVRCVAHTLQLCILDTIKNSWSDAQITMNIYLETIRLARNLAKELRTQNVLILLRQKNLRKPVLDVQTRWGSTYMMLQGVLSLKEFCSTCVAYGNTKLKLCDEEWGRIEEIVTSLKPSYEATNKLQYENITLTELYTVWHMCHHKTAEIGLPFSNELVINMTIRRDNVMECPAMLSVMYLDPRYCFELTDEQKDSAKAQIKKLNTRLLELKARTEIPVQSSDTDDITDLDDDDQRYERQLLIEQKCIEKRNHNKKFLIPNFENALLAFGNLKRLPHNTQILKYWQENAKLYKTLYSVAQAVFSVPGTQVSVERLFSELKFILSDLRMSLSPENINNLLLVRCNFNNLDDYFDSL